MIKKSMVVKLNGKADAMSAAMLVQVASKSESGL